MLPRETKIGLDNRDITKETKAKGSIARFVQKNYHHFNAATLKNATEAYIKLINDDGKMFLAMAGAMSTAELGVSLAEMIRKDKIHGISCTGANLEEDIFMLVAHDEYVKLPDWRDLTPQDEKKLMKSKINRVTDVGIPEHSAMTPIENTITNMWKECQADGGRKFPHEFLYDLLLSGKLEKHYQNDPKNSWMLAAAEKNLHIVVPGWEDSTLGNVFAAMCYQGDLLPSTIKSGIEYMLSMIEWYEEISKKHDVGFFQIGGGIAGDFPICVVPLLQQDMKQSKTELWKYFCQISDAVTSYGGYSGATPNEKITWGKIGPETPSFVIESDATIVAPLIFAQVLGL